MSKPRIIESLVKQCFKRYPVPMTAWQIAKIIGRNPASVSSRLHRMYVAKKTIAFLGRRLEILYAPLTLNPTVQIIYSFAKNTKMYSAEAYRDARL